MARTDIAAVRGILSTAESAALTDPQITAAIEAATVMVDRIADAPCHDATSLELVERYLAADIAVQTTFGGDITEEKIGDASEKRSKTAGGDSNYLKTAYRLDCSGMLADFAKPSIVFQPFGGADDDVT